jgi:anti-sigma regulatory factor (Ser/Thr protein kinase)
MDLNAPSSPMELIEVSDASQVGGARRVAQQLALHLNFDEAARGRTALVTTELATNIVKHAGRGAIYLREVANPEGAGIEIIAVDKGPGFDVARCLPDGMSTRGTSGIGLGAALRQSQVFDAYASEHGSIVMARLYRKQSKDQRVGVVHVALEGHQECGDTWRVVQAPGHLVALVIDGLGHGHEAAAAANLGGEAFEKTPLAEPSTLMVELNVAMAGSRGGAAAVAHYDTATNALRYAGIGNIAAFLINASRSKGLASQPGIVGLQVRKVHTFSIEDVRPDLLIMHSDGIQSRWNLQTYPGVLHRHPAIIAALLHRDFCRGRDDATILVIAIGDVQ